MDNLYTMGFNCRSFISGLLVVLALSAFAEFTPSDSDHLGSIDVNTDTLVGDVGVIKTTLETFRLENYITLNEVKYTVNDIRTTLSTANVRLKSILDSLPNITTDLELELDSFHNDFNTKVRINNAHRILVESTFDSTASDIILSLLYPIQSIDGKIVLTSYHSDVSDAIKVHDPCSDDILFQMGGITFFATNSFNRASSDILSALGAIAAGVSNFVNQSPAAYSPAFLTNYYASSLPFFFPQLNDKSMRNIYNILFGHFPTDTERNQFSQFYQWSSMASGLQDYLSSISADNLSQSSLYSSLESSYRIILMAMGLSSSAANTQIANVKNMARERYYQYGTRPLIQFFESATNDYPLASHSVITQVQTPDGPKPGFASGFVDTVSSLASSFQIDTNLATVSTEEIVDIENPHISGTWEQVRNETPDNNALSDLSNTIQSSLAADSSTVLNIFNESGAQSLDFQFPISIGPSEYQLNYSIPATASLYRPYVAFFAAIVKGIIVMYFGLQIWEKVVKEVWMGRRF